MTFDVQRLPELLNPPDQRLEQARQRQAAVWRGETPDRWPIFLGAPLTPEQQAIPNPDLREAFYDADLMLCSQVRGACSSANSGSDAVPSIRGNFGVGTTLACVGLEQQVFPDKMPWLKQHLTREQIARLEPDDIRIQGTFERGLDAMRRFEEVMQGTVAVYCMDTQGPLDLAHLMIGDDLFVLFLDDPPFVHHLLELCVELGVRTHTWMKEVTGEPLDQIYHANNLYAENMGIRICEDTTAVLGPHTIEEFALPYTARLASHFGGGWMHYCGRHDGLTEMACAMPDLRGINFGHIPGFEHDHPFEEDLEICLKGGKVYYGPWPRRPTENGREYLDRLHSWARQGCLIASADAAIGGEDGFPGVGEALDYWYNL